MPKGNTLGVGIDLALTPHQHMKAGEFGTVKKTGGGWQSTFERIHAETQQKNGQHVVRVYPAVLKKLKKWASYDVSGSYQEWCRAVLAANSIRWP